MSLGRLLVFFTVVLSVSGAIHYYLWARLVRDVGWPAPYGLYLKWALIALAVSFPLFLPVSRALPREFATPLAYLVYGWLGLMFLLFALLVPADLIRGLAWLIERLAGAPADPERRQFLARLFGGLVGVGALGTAGYGAGCTLVEVSSDNVPTEKYDEQARKLMKNHHGGVIKLGDNLYCHSDGVG